MNYIEKLSEVIASVSPANCIVEVDRTTDGRGGRAYELHVIHKLPDADEGEIIHTTYSFSKRGLKRPLRMLWDAGFEMDPTMMDIDF